MEFSMTGQDKGDLLIEVTAWAGFTVYLMSFSSSQFVELGVLQKQSFEDSDYYFQQKKQKKTKNYSVDNIIKLISI